jgi:CDP-glucose 4,6-dehydratase
MLDFNKISSTVFITGASGFIGRSLVTRLLLDGSSGKIILLSRTHQFEDLVVSNPDRIVVIKGDINNLELLVHIIKTYHVEYVYHLAAEAIIAEYIRNPMEAYLNTVQGATSLLEAVRVSLVPVKKVIISTSYKVYGRSDPPYNEETSFSPGNTYETAKACQDFIAQDYFRTFKVPVIIFRTVNVYGPGDKNLTRLIPRSFSNVLQGISPVVYVSSKDSLREFIFIDDLIDAIVVIKEKASPGDIYCVGGKQYAIYDVVQTVCTVSGYRGGIELREVSSVVETKEHSLDSSKLIELGWSPKFSLVEGLKKTVEYYKALSS